MNLTLDSDGLLTCPKCRERYEDHDEAAKCFVETASEVAAILLPDYEFPQWCFDEWPEMVLGMLLGADPEECSACLNWRRVEALAAELQAGMWPIVEASVRLQLESNGYERVDDAGPAPQIATYDPNQAEMWEGFPRLPYLLTA